MAPFVPPDEQTAGVVTLKVTVRCEDAVALTVTGDWSSVLLAGVPNVIVWFYRREGESRIAVHVVIQGQDPVRAIRVSGQPAKLEPAAAAALSVTTVPAVYDCEQSPPQLMPAGLLVTVPVPVPDRVTVSSDPTTQPVNETVET